MKTIKFAVAGLALAFSSLSFAADWAPGSMDWGKLPEVKVSKLGLYLTPQQAYEMKKASPRG